MSALSGHVDDYLRLRRALGFKLEREGQWLTQLAAYVDAAGAATLTSDLAVAWARQRTGAGPNGWAKRLGVVRKFAAFLHTIDPAAEIPPPGVFPARRHRPTPYLWSSHDIGRLLDGARALQSPLRAASHEALFGLLASSGMRIGEAVALQNGDVDLGLVAGIDVKIVSERLGHSSPLITWQTYEHVTKGMQTDAAEKVPALIFVSSTA